MRSRTKRTLRVGLTGGIGTGKTEALRAFERAGAVTVSLDGIAHELSRRGRPVRRAILREFGRAVLGPDGEIDRGALAERVFSRPRLRRRLEAAAHPHILREMRRRLKRARRPVAVVDAPLLFEAGIQDEFDVNVVVSAPRRAQVSRVMRRDGLSRRRAELRLKAQLPVARKERLADIVIRNEGSRAELRSKVAEYQNAFDLIARGLQMTARRRK